MSRWSERQQQLLSAMGLALIEPPGAPAAEADDSAAAPAPAPRAAIIAPSANAEAPAARMVAPPPRAERSTGDRAAGDRGAPAPKTAHAEPARGPLPAGEVATMDWDALHAAIDACRACALGSTRRHPVVGTGHRQAQWMIVGEAPGEQEDAQGEPFVGKSGQLLDSMLRAIGLTRGNTAGALGLKAQGDPATQVYIANTLKCRPPGNRNPQPDELAHCERFLIRQIELVRPRIILAMGRFAVQSLLRSDEPVGRLRGRVHRYQGVPLVVTYHPAYLLRNLEDKARAWDDLCLALETFEALPRG